MVDDYRTVRLLGSNTSKMFIEIKVRRDFEGWTALDFICGGIQKLLEHVPGLLEVYRIERQAADLEKDDDPAFIDV